MPDVVNLVLIKGDRYYAQWLVLLWVAVLARKATPEIPIANAFQKVNVRQLITVPLPADQTKNSLHVDLLVHHNVEMS